MGAAGRRRASAAEIVAVAGLIAVGVAAVTAMVLHERGTWFEPATAAMILDVLWVLIWLPGMAFCLILFLRSKRPELLAGFLLQGVAIAIYWAVGETRPANVVGVFGTFLPVLPRLSGTKGRKALGVGIVLAAVALAYAVSWTWILLGMLVPMWVYWYGREIWPALDRALAQEQREPARWERWLTWGSLVVIGMLAVLVGAITLWWWIVVHYPSGVVK